MAWCGDIGKLIGSDDCPCKQKYYDAIYSNGSVNGQLIWCQQNCKAKYECDAYWAYTLLNQIIVTEMRRMSNVPD